MKQTTLHKYIKFLLSFSHLIAFIGYAQNSQPTAGKAYPLLLQAEDVQNHFVLPADMELVHKASGKIIALQYNATAMQYQAVVTVGETYDVRISMKGYYSQRTFFVCETPKDSKPLKVIKLDPTTSNVIINAMDAVSNLPLKMWRATLTELQTGRSSTFLVDTPEGVVRTQLVEGRKYRIDVLANTYETAKEEFVKDANSQEFTLKLTARKAAFVTLKAVEAESALPIAAKFKVVSRQRKKPVEGKTSLEAPNFTVEVLDQSPWAVEVEAEGFAPVSQQIDVRNLQSGEVKEVAIALKTTLFPLSIRVLDADTKKTVEKVLVKVTDFALSEVRPVTKTGKSEFSVLMKHKQNFEIMVRADGYNVLTQNIDKWPEKGQITMFVSKRRHATVLFSVVDASTGKPIKVQQMSVKPQSNTDKEVFNDCTEAEVVAYNKEVFTIETTAEGYQPKQSTFNMADFENGKKYNYVIRLDKSLLKVAIKAIDKKNQEVVSVGSYALYDAKEANSQIAVERGDDGSAYAMLSPEKNYRLEMVAQGYERFVQNFTIGAAQQQLVCPMIRSGKTLMLTISLRDSVSHKPLEGIVTATNAEHTWEYEKKAVAGSMEVKIPLPRLGLYQLAITAKGYYHRQTTLAVNAVEQVLSQVVFLSKIPKDLDVQAVQDLPTVPAWNNIYFEQSSFQLQASSYPILDELTARLLSDKQLKIDIIGHTDNVGDPKLNLALAENRARVIFNYLVNKGIDESRLFYKGYGGQRPVAPNDSEDNKKRNRRVEIKLRTAL